MKTLIKSMLFSCLITYSGNLFGQNEQYSLKCSDFVVGLSNTDFLRERLNEKAFQIIENQEMFDKGGNDEQWVKSMFYKVEILSCLSSI
jgi:hypothetical protein